MFTKSVLIEGEEIDVLVHWFYQSNEVVAIVVARVPISFYSRNEKALQTKVIAEKRECVNIILVNTLQ